HQIVHGSAGRFDDAINARKDLPGLFVLILADQVETAFKGTRYLTGDEQTAACAYGVRPQIGAGLGYIGDGQFCPGHGILLVKLSRIRFAVCSIPTIGNTTAPLPAHCALRAREKPAAIQRCFSGSGWSPSIPLAMALRATSISSACPATRALHSSARLTRA